MVNEKRLLRRLIAEVITSQSTKRAVSGERFSLSGNMSWEEGQDSYADLIRAVHFLFVEEKSQHGWSARNDAAFIDHVRELMSAKGVPEQMSTKMLTFMQDNP